MMNTPTTVNLQIKRFCNCDGCIQKVKSILREIGGVRLLSMDPETGKLAISTAKHPQVVQFALQKKFRQVDILPQEITLPNHQLSGLSSLVPSQGTVNVQDMANALVTISGAQGLQSVEYRQSNTLRFNFTNHENRPSSSRLPATHHDSNDRIGFEYVLPPPPPSTTEPSAPLIPTTTQDQVTGYPPEYYGFSRRDDPHGCCTIL